MTSELKNEAQTLADDELDTTAPQSKSAVWKMPEPVFRKTSGRLPSAFVRDIAGAPSETAPAPTPAEQNAVDPKPKNPTLKVIVVLLGLAAMIAFLIVFLTVVYFFFLR